MDVLAACVLRNGQCKLHNNSLPPLCLSLIESLSIGVELDSVAHSVLSVYLHFLLHLYADLIGARASYLAGVPHDSEPSAKKIQRELLILKRRHLERKNERMNWKSTSTIYSMEKRHSLSLEICFFNSLLN